MQSTDSIAAKTFVSAEAALPVTAVKVWSNGLINVERRGRIASGTVVILPVPSDGADETLRSMTWEGKVASVDRERHAPIKGIAGAALEKSRGDMLSLVQNMVGADIVIEREGKSEPVEGCISGCSEETVSGRDPEQVISLLLKSGEVVKVPSSSIRCLRFADTRVTQELQAKLHRTFHSHLTAVTLLNIVVGGSWGTKEDIIVRYNLGGIPWSTAYHVTLPEMSESKGSGDDSTSAVTFPVECMAFVDNVTPEDWNVDITLVAGAPKAAAGDSGGGSGSVSTDDSNGMQLFIKDMTGRSTAVRISSSSTIGNLKQKLERILGIAPSNIRLLFAGKMLEDGRTLSSYNIQKESSLIMVSSSSSSSSSTEKPAKLSNLPMVDGDSLSEYRVKEKVVLPRGRSALIPYAACELQGEEVALYNFDGQCRGVLDQGLRVSNTSGKTLEMGTVILKRSTSGYIGESVVKTLLPNDDVFLSYASLLKAEVARTQETKDGAVHAMRMKNSVVYLDYTRIIVTTYTIASKYKESSAPLNVFLKHDIKRGYELDEERLPSNAELVDAEVDWVKLNFKAPPDAVTSIVLQERTVQTKSTSITWSLLAALEDLDDFYRRLGVPSDVDAQFAAGMEDLMTKAKALEKMYAEATEAADVRRKTESDINSLKDILKAVNTSGKSITAGKFEEELMAKFTRHKEQQAIEEEKRAWASISAAAFDKAARALTLEKSL